MIVIVDPESIIIRKPFSTLADLASSFVSSFFNACFSNSALFNFLCLIPQIAANSHIFEVLILILSPAVRGRTH